MAIFIDNQGNGTKGMAMQDLIIAAELMRLARARGVGEELSLGT